MIECYLCNREIKEIAIDCYKHINIYNNPKRKDFCSKDCKLKWIYQINKINKYRSWFKKMNKICRKCTHRIIGCKSKPTLESRTCKQIIESLVPLTFNIFGSCKCVDSDNINDILENEYNDESLEIEAYNNLESEKDN